MSATARRGRTEVRQLPASARQAAAVKVGERGGQVARSRFALTFADVLSGRFGGRWSVEWGAADRPPSRGSRSDSSSNW
jgi:hypothetical protein